MIKLRNVEKNYVNNGSQIQVLNNINLTIKAGEIFGIIGKSGAGKSTLLRCMNLLERPCAGEVVVAGQNLVTLNKAALRQARHQIGMIFQNFNLISTRTVFANIALPLELMGYSKQKIMATVVPLLELTGLAAKTDAYPQQLSGGQKQRVAIARALASQPKILLCDEATSALDLHTTETILQLLKDINKQLGITIVLITHEMEVVKSICDRIALLDQGEILEEAELLEFFTKPKSTLAQELLQVYLKKELPLTLQNKLLPEINKSQNPILRIIFFGEPAYEPLIATLMQQFQIKLNIWQANIELLKKVMVGMMIVEVMEHQHNLTAAIAYLQQKGLLVETVGYV